jgi:hypothetical protein
VVERGFWRSAGAVIAVDVCDAALDAEGVVLEVVDTEVNDVGGVWPVLGLRDRGGGGRGRVS